MAIGSPCMLWISTAQSRSLDVMTSLSPISIDLILSSRDGILDGIRARSDAEVYKSVSSEPSAVSPLLNRGYMGPLFLSWETV